MDSLVTTVRVDQRLLDDPTYVGKRFRGMAGFTEQAYLRLTTQHLEVTFGRDVLWWGPSVECGYRGSGSVNSWCP